MIETKLEQIIEAADALPPEDLRRLREWLEQKERQAADQGQLEKEAENFRKAMTWLDENRSKYLGQWVALDGDKLISHGLDAREVYEAALAAGIDSPVLERVVEKETQPYWAGW
ncbi:MAG: DUF5678 domain-containing protein [Acidobacteriota bacterium]